MKITTAVHYKAEKTQTVRYDSPQKDSALHAIYISKDALEFMKVHGKYPKRLFIIIDDDKEV